MLRDVIMCSIFGLYFQCNDLKVGNGNKSGPGVSTKGKADTHEPFHQNIYQGTTGHDNVDNTNTIIDNE